jgi:hypothetical protein
VRSPWYDAQCERPGATPQSIAQELDRDPGGSAYQFFGSVIDKAKKGTTSPFVKGDMSFDAMASEGDFVEMPNGPFWLWFNPAELEKREERQFVVSVDVSAGTGGDYSSSSVIQIWDTITGDQMAEYTTNTMSPEVLARLSVAVCRWVRGKSGKAFLIWDAQGSTGSQYTNSLIDTTDYRDIYRRSIKHVKSLSGRKTDAPGYWHLNKEEPLGALRDAILRDRAKIQSLPCATELGEFEMRRGKVEHTGAATSEVERGKAHGDRVMAAALGVIAMDDRPGQVKEVEKKEPPPDSMAGRMARRKRRERQTSLCSW